jgi:iron complex outermembrane recepter protein
MVAAPVAGALSTQSARSVWRRACSPGSFPACRAFSASAPSAVRQARLSELRRDRHLLHLTMKSRPTTLVSLCLLVAAPAAFAADDIIQLDKLNVTAQKRVQSIADVPVPITAYTGSFLERAGITDYKNFAPLVPGLFIQEQSPNNPGINMRGITTDSGDPRSETRISIFQDGVSISRSRASVVELFDLERIEVLKGPQGTLFGRGAEIGAISIIQNKARNESSGMLTAGFGNFSDRRASGNANVPIIADQLFGRFAFSWREQDGTVENLVDGSTLNGKETLALRGAVRWQPTAMTSIDVIANWQNDTPPGTAFKSGVIPTSRGDTNPFTAAELTRGSALGLDRTVGGVTAVIEHTLDKAWSVTSTTGWREYDAYENFDADGARIPLLEFAEDSRGRQFSQELRFNFNDGGKFSGFFGASYFHENGSSRVPLYTDERQLWPFLADSFRGALVGGGIPAPLADLLVPRANPFVPQTNLPVSFAAFNTPLLPAQVRGFSALAGAPLQSYQQAEYTQAGRTRATDLFLDGTWRATPQLEFTAGVRYTREKIDSSYEASNRTPPTLAFITYQIPGYPYLPTAGRRSASSSSSSWDGRLIGRFEFSKTLNAYASVSRGHRPESLLLDSTTTVPVDEEEVINYEAGLKGSLVAGRVQWSASVFRYDYSDFQTTVLSLGRFTTENAGNATGEGFEFGLQGRVHERVSAFANYAYTDATFDARDDQGRPQQYGGNRFRLTPKTAFSLGATFTMPNTASGQLFITPIWSFKSKHFFDDNNALFNYGLRQNAYSLVNLRAGWRSPKGRWQITGYAENLFDQDHLIDAGNVGGSFGLPTFVAGDPRRYGVQTSMRW